MLQTSRQFMVNRLLSMKYRLLNWVIPLLFIGGAIPSYAEGPPPFPQFEAKRIKPPSSGSGQRINVQIGINNADAAPAAGATDQPISEEAEGDFGWFWSAISPSAEKAGPWRLEDAMNVLQKSDARAALPAPRLQSLQELAQSHGIDILRASIGTEVSPALVLAVMYVESRGRADAVSAAGAEGVMQLMPATAERFGVSDPFQASESIMGGIAYLDVLMKRFEGDPILVLAGYNAGEGAIAEHGGVPPYDETRGYVPKVLQAYAVARGLCVTPPLFISDGCVFAVSKS
jgi:soluble lytic murein transglycosylase-like protein